MKLVWHLAKADLRHLRWPLAVWVLAVVVNVACSACQLRLPAPLQWPWLFPDLLNLVSIVTRWGLTVVLAAQLIQADPLHTSTGFWLTRPIGGTRMFAAKAVGLAILVLGPALLDAAVVAGFRISGWVWLVALLEFASTGAVVVAAAAAYATVAGTFGSFILRGIILLAAGSFAGFTADVLVNPNRLVGIAQPLPTDSLVISGWWAAKLAILAGGAAFLAWQYRQRHFRAALPIAFLGTVLVMMLPTYWPWDFFGYPAETRAAAGAPPIGLQSPVLRAALTYRNGVVLAGEVGCVAQADGRFLDPVSVRGEAMLVWPDQRSRFVAGAYRRVAPPADPASLAPAALARFLAPVRLLNPVPLVARTLNLLNLRSDDAQRLARAPAAVTAEMDVRVRGFAVEAELPAAAGGRAAGSSWRVRIEQTSMAAGAARFTLREDAYLSLLAGPEQPLSELPFVALPMAASVRYSEQKVLYLLANRARGEALLPRPVPAHPRSGGFGHFYTWRRDLEFASAPMGARPEEWLRGATLLRIRLVDLGRVTCTLRADGVTARL
jgi:hypothetical protein